MLSAALMAGLGSPVVGTSAEPATEPRATSPSAGTRSPHSGWSPAPSEPAGAVAVSQSSGLLPTHWLAAHLPQQSSRHVGRGIPLSGTSWLNRPYYAAWFMGSWFGDPLIGDQVVQEDGFFGGYLLGYDLNHYWGSELRMTMSYIDTEYLPDHVHGGSTRNVPIDLNLLYYPWGDAQWRPFFTLGMGLTGYHFIAPENRAIDEVTFAMPWGIGVKYQFRRWMALRLDWKDNLTFANGDVETMNNWSLTAGVEVHWGPNSSGRYYPW